MDDKTLEEIKERNRNLKKRIKFYYTGVYGLLAAWLLWGFVMVALAGSKTGLTIGVVVFAILFIPWMVLCVSSSYILRCPHCDTSIYRADPLHIRKCPYCGTNLKEF